MRALNLERGCYVHDVHASEYREEGQRENQLQGEDMKRNPEMDKLAVWAGTGCMAVSPISGLRFMSSPCTVATKCVHLWFDLTNEF